MNGQKVEQVLKQIFEMYGVEIVRKQSSFRAAVFDLLDEQNYRDERIVLRNAIEADAILPLVTVSPVTEDAAARAEEMLKKSAHMAAEDAEFVIRCVVAARGQNPDLVMEKNPPRKDMKKVQLKTEQEQNQQYEYAQAGSAAKNTISKASVGGKTKRLAVSICFGILIYVLGFGLLYLIDEMDFKYIPISAAAIAGCAACWIHKQAASNIIVTFILAIVWGAAGFLIWFLVYDGIYNYYCGTDYRSALMEYVREAESSDSTLDSHEILNNIFDNNNGSFSYQGRKYGLSYETEQMILAVDAVVVCVLIHILQKLILRKITKRNSTQKGHSY